MASSTMPSSNTMNFLYTLWLFTLSDIMTFVVPQTAFGVLSALSGPLLTAQSTPNLTRILWRLPYTVFWTWLNTFVFTLANQRRTESVLEDKLNKPWRPLPAGRVSEEDTKRLLFVSIPVSLAIIHFGLGASQETMLLFCLTWMYNDLGGSDDNFIVRNLVIASAYPLYGSGALRVTCNTPGDIINSNITSWSLMIGGIIFTTMHVQDLKDMVGDKARHRQTAPLVVGEMPTRYFLGCAISCWSTICSMYWRCNLALSVGLTAYAGLISYRLLFLRSSDADRMTWKLWSYWLICVYGLPLAKYLSG